MVGLVTGIQNFLHLGSRTSSPYHLPFASISQCGTIWTVPFSFWLIFQTNAAKMEPFDLALWEAKISIR